MADFFSWENLDEVGKEVDQHMLIKVFFRG